VLFWSPLLVGLLVYAWTTPSLVGCAVAIFACSVLQAQFAFIGHDASHGSAAADRTRNQLAGLLSMGVASGLCFKEWQSRHLQHHRHCQDQARDPDMQFASTFSLSEQSLAEKVGWGRAIAPYQAYYFWPTTLLFAHSLRVMSLVAAVKQPRKYSADLLSVAFHFAIWLLLPVVWLQADWRRVIVVYLVASSLLGLRLAMVFTVNHVGMPSARAGSSFLEHQVVTSRNIDNSRWLDWFFGGLNFQIEHHLVPACSRVRLRAASRIVRPAVLASGLHHHACSWPAAMFAVSRHVASVVRPRSPAE
jgi:fatty acid desaturase